MQFARNVLDITEEDEARAIELGIEKLCAFYQSLGMPITLRGLGAEDCPIDSLARHCCRCGRVGHLEPLDAADVAGILTSAR